MTITSEDAIARARRVADERGWPWQEPVHVARRRAYVFFGGVTYEIRTNATTRGQNARIVVDAEDGSVLEARWLPR
jgi:hypothetical protein